ncbi:MAG TPA: carboxypeptidase regulatory-like domain-containing protein [Planctomycetota bacterium]
MAPIDRTARSLRAVGIAIALGSAVLAQQDPPITLSGRVVDMRGEGLPVAKVWVQSREVTGSTWTTQTDGEGYYRLRVPRSGAWRLHAQTTGYSHVAHFLHEPFAPMRVVVHETATLCGVLCDAAGKPAGGVVVFAEPALTPTETVALATTDQHGRFELGGVPLGPNRIVAWIEGQGLVTTTLRVVGDGPVTLEPFAGATTSLSVELKDVPEADRSRVTLTLTVNLDNGGISGRPELPPPFFVRGVAAGGWRLDHLPQGEQIVNAYATGIRFRPGGLTTPPGKGPHEFEFVAKWPEPKPTTVRATVLDATGAPVAGLRVGYYGTSYSPRVEATSTADGQLSIESPWSIEEGSLHSLDERWLLRWRSRATLPEKRMLLRAQTDRIEIEAVRACSITGSARRPDGQPAALARVRLWSADRASSPPWQRLAETWTGIDGEFTFTWLVADERRLRLTIDSQDGLLRQDGVTLPAAGATKALGELRLEAAAAVEGVVRTPDGSPAIGLRVDLCDFDAKAGRHGAGHNALVVTDSRGRFRFLGVPAGSAQLAVWPERPGFLRPEPPFEAEAGRTHQFEVLEPRR